MLITTRLPQNTREAPTRAREGSVPAAASPALPSSSSPVRTGEGPAVGGGSRPAPGPPVDEVSAKLEQVITRMTTVSTNGGPGPAKGEGVSLGEDVGMTMAVATGAANELHPGARTPAPPAPTRVDAGAIFNAVDPAQRPRFEGGQQVVAGSFMLNGKRIEVRGDDSISAVLQRMSENLPELQASFADDKVRLSMRARQRKPVTVEEDSSGFVSATGLGAAARALSGAMASASRAERAYGEDDQRDPLLRPRRAG